MQIAFLETAAAGTDRARGSKKAIRKAEGYADRTTSTRRQRWAHPNTVTH